MSSGTMIVVVVVVVLVAPVVEKVLLAQRNEFARFGLIARTANCAA